MEAEMDAAGNAAAVSGGAGQCAAASVLHIVVPYHRGPTVWSTAPRLPRQSPADGRRAGRPVLRDRYTRCASAADNVFRLDSFVGAAAAAAASPPHCTPDPPPGPVHTPPPPPLPQLPAGPPPAPSTLAHAPPRTALPPPPPPAPLSAPGFSPAPLERSEDEADCINHCPNKSIKPRRQGCQRRGINSSPAPWPPQNGRSS
ncbi:leucine-rich repeat extensin-like protein 3 [Schistocerca piceifrons]|uniref:leucine-rich repeat extensin-like protein 3 n=1 Tax=Schistocerca piceifrons TaxID=274613 RepID=UPI001F5E9D98|nr:leucine-rich repeat extensin-like protein 3 [Schistocerca piceifrons]